MFIRGSAIAILLTPFTLDVPAIAEPEAKGSKEAASREILDRYLDGAETMRSDAGAALTFEIDALLPRMHKHGTMRGLRLATGAGRVVFMELHFVGDDLVKTAVHTRGGSF